MIGGLLSALGKLVEAAPTIGRVLAAGERVLRRLVPERPRDSEPIPLTYRHVSHQQAQIRQATSHRVDGSERLPRPPRLPSRYD